MAEFYVVAHEDWEGLTSSFAYYTWNVLMVGIPYDTGNARSSFKLKNNSLKHISYFFDSSEAYYVEYLETGVGPVKKYKSFIEHGLVGLALQETISFIKTNKSGLLTSRPTVVLRESQYRNPFPYERKILKYSDKNIVNLNADERKKISQIMYRSIEDSNKSSFGGKRASIKRQYKKNSSESIDYYYIDEKDKLL